jgi:peptidoglycan/LPS O-acetylase OafA/YrhL
MVFYDAMEVFGIILRAVGALVFGVGAGWLTLRAFQMQAHGWPLPLGALLGLLAAFVLIGNWVPGGGALGAFGLGAGGALLVWGLGAARKPEEAEPAETKTVVKKGRAR